MEAHTIGLYEWHDPPLTEDAFGKLYTGVNTQNGDAVLIRQGHTAPAFALGVFHGGLVFANDEIVDSTGHYTVAPTPEGDLLQVKWQELRQQGLVGYYFILKILLEVARSVEELHKNWLVHGQINPSVILVRPGYPVRTCLLCMQPFEQQRAGDFLKAHDYLEFVPQEQLRGAGGPSSDIFALGMLLYESFVQDAPYAASSPHELAEAILWGDMLPYQSRVDGLQEDLAGELAADIETLGMVIAKATNRNPRERYETVTELIQTLSQLVRRFDPVEVGERLAGQGRYQLAVSVLESAVEMPDPARAYLLLGQIYGFELDEPTKGIVAFKKALNENPNLESAVLSRARLYAQQQRFKLAKHEIMTLIEREPGNIAYMQAYAQILVQEGEVESALNVLHRVQSENPYHLPAYKMAIQIQIDLGQLRLAEIECNHALEAISSVIQMGNLDPWQVADLYHLRGVIHNLSHRSDRAITWLKKALELAPTHVESHAMLVELYNQTGQPQLAFQHLLESLSLEANPDGIMRRLEELLAQQPNQDSSEGLP